MTKNEVVNKVRVLLGLEKFDEATLIDGTKITNDSDDKFAPGQMLYVTDEEGNKVAAPEGEHATESGITVTVDAAGMITGVKEPDAEGEGSLEASKFEEEEKKEEEAMEEEIEDAVEEAAEEEIVLTPETVIEAIAPIIEEVAMMKKSIEDMRAEFEDYKNGPAKESMKKSFSKEMNMANGDAVSRIARLRAEFNNK